MQVTTLETPSLMAHVSRVLFLVAIMVVAMVVLPPSHVHLEKKDDNTIVNRHRYTMLQYLYLTDILDIYMNTFLILQLCRSMLLSYAELPQKLREQMRERVVYCFNLF
jgi:hypothetical protein